MHTRTDAMLRSCLEMLDDDSRPDELKVALCRSQITVVVARRRAARTMRGIVGTVTRFGMSLADHDPYAEL